MAYKEGKLGAQDITVLAPHLHVATMVFIAMLTQMPGEA